MRLIDADALKCEKFYSHERHENCVSVYAIDMMQTIEPERQHGEWKTESAIDYLTEIGWLPEHDRILTERPQWIPCSERLPPYSEKIVLATVVRRDKTWNNEPYHRLVTYSNGKWYPVPQSINLVPCRMATIEQSDGGQAEVIAWMSLPKPYEKEGDKE